MSTDFFDDDLLQSGAPDAQEDGGPEATKEEQAAGEAGDRLARQRQDLSKQAAESAKELERLRSRQSELEREKGDLSDLGRKQEDYERGKRDILDKLHRGIALMEKEEVQGQRMLELLGVMRQRFKDSLAEISAIDEETWTDKDFRDELNRALVLVDDARMIYKKALAKIDAENWHKNAGTSSQPNVLQEVNWLSSIDKGFGFWLKVGCAFSLPVVIVIVAVFAAYLVLAGLV